MQKQELLDLIKQQIASGNISASEVASALQLQSSASPTTDSNKKRLSATSILYSIGGLILVLGIGAFVFSFWDNLNGLVRVLITLGFAAAAYIAGAMLRGDADHGKISRVLFFISGILAPIGAFVTLDSLRIDYGSFGWSATIAFLLSVIYASSLFFFRTAEFAFFTTIFSTWMIYAVVGYAIDLSGSATMLEHTYKYLTIAIGAAYLLIQSVIASGKINEETGARDQQAFDRFLTFFGATGIFGAMIALSDWSPNQSVAWEFLSVVAVLGGLVLASRTANRTLLKTSALFVFVLIIRFTSEYFVDSLGWPIALIVAGIALLAAGYGLVALGKKK